MKFPATSRVAAALSLTLALLVPPSAAQQPKPRPTPTTMLDFKNVRRLKATSRALPTASADDMPVASASRAIRNSFESLRRAEERGPRMDMPPAGSRTVRSSA